MAFAGLPLILFKPNEPRAVNLGIVFPILLQIIVQFVPNTLVRFSITQYYLELINKSAVFSVTAIIVLYVYFFSKVILGYATQVMEKNKELEGTLEKERELRIYTQLQAKELKAANEQLREKAAIDKELETAREIQQNVLPEFSPPYRGYHIDHFFLPAKQVGGDYYDYFPLSATKFGIVVADIVGKGIPASLMMIAFKSLIHKVINRTDSPAQTLEKLNTVIFQNKILSRYIPIMYGILDTKAHTFTYSNAGHEPGLWFSKTEGRELSIGGVPAGMYETQIFEEETICLEANDRIVLFTDGLTDIKNNEGAFLGIEALRLLMGSHATSSDNDFVERVSFEILSYFSGQAQADDITMVTMKRLE